MPTLAKTLPGGLKHRGPPAALDITATARSTEKMAINNGSPATSPRVALRMEINEAVASVTLSCLTTSGSKEPSSAESVASRDELDSDHDSAASALTSPVAFVDCVAARQVPGSSSAAFARPEAGSATSAASSSAASLTHELLPILLMPLRLKGDYCNVAVLNASEATLAQMRKIEAGADEVLVEDSEVIKILNGHIGRPVRGVAVLCNTCKLMHARASSKHARATCVQQVAFESMVGFASQEPLSLI